METDPRPDTASPPIPIPGGGRVRRQSSLPVQIPTQYERRRARTNPETYTQIGDSWSPMIKRDKSTDAISTGGLMMLMWEPSSSESDGGILVDDNKGAEQPRPTGDRASKSTLRRSDSVDDLVSLTSTMMIEPSGGDQRARAAPAGIRSSPSTEGKPPAGSRSLWIRRHERDEFRWPRSVDSPVLDVHVYDSPPRLQDRVPDGFSDRVDEKQAPLRKRLALQQLRKRRSSGMSGEEDVDADDETWRRRHAIRRRSSFPAFVHDEDHEAPVESAFPKRSEPTAVRPSNSDREHL